MALTITEDGRASHSGNTQTTLLTVTFDSSYPTGGESFNADNYGLGRMVSITFAGKGTGTGFVPSYDATNKKILLFQGPPGDGQAVSPGPAVPLPEVGDTEDASSAVFLVTIVSRR